MEEHGPEATLPIFEETLADLLDGTANRFRGALHLDDALGRLRQHILGRDHTRARAVLNGFDFETIATDDGAHQIVRDEQSDRGVRRWRGGGDRGGGRRADELRNDQGVRLYAQSLLDNNLEKYICTCLSDTLHRPGDGENALMHAWDDLADTGLDPSLLTEVCDVLARFADDDAGLFGTNECTQSQSVLGRRGGRARLRAGRAYSMQRKKI